MTNQPLLEERGYSHALVPDTAPLQLPPRPVPLAVSAPLPAMSDQTTSGTILKPKRNLSAYNFFFKSEREKLLASLPVRPQGKPRKSHGKLGFQAMAKIIGARWRTLDLTTVAYYNDLAARDKYRYKKELKEYQHRMKELQVHQLPVQDKTTPSVNMNLETSSTEYDIEPLSTNVRGIADLAQRLDEESQMLIIKLFRDG